MAARKMKDGRYCVWFSFGRDPETGKRLRRRVEAPTKRRAEAKARELRARYDRGEDVLEKPRILSELLDDWIRAVEREGKAASTILSYRQGCTNHLKPRLGTVPVPKLRARALQKHFDELADRYAPGYVRRLKTTLVMALNFAIEQGEISSNPARPVRVPSGRSKVGRSFTPDEVQALLTAAVSYRHGCAIPLGLMGLRRGEIPALMWTDLDEQTGELTVARQFQRIAGRWEVIPAKRGSVRVLTLGPRLLASLQLLRRAQEVERQAMGWEPCPYIFVSSRTGGPCPPDAIYVTFRQIAREAGIAPARLHDLRHTAATALLGEGEGLPTVAEVLGHADSRVTAETYGHALEHKVARASKNLENILLRGSEEGKRRSG